LRQAFNVVTQLSVQKACGIIAGCAEHRHIAEHGVKALRPVCVIRLRRQMGNPA
jgi:hypothetical protein